MTLADAACLLPVYCNIGHYQVDYMFALYLEIGPPCKMGRLYKSTPPPSSALASRPLATWE